MQIYFRWLLFPYGYLRNHQYAYLDELDELEEEDDEELEDDDDELDEEEELEELEDDDELDEPDEDESSLMRGFLTSLVLPWHLKANLSSATISSHQLVPRSSDCCLVPMKNSQMARPLDTGKRQQDLHKQ